jgi:hypothetical protein
MHVATGAYGCGLPLRLASPPVSTSGGCRLLCRHVCVHAGRAKREEQARQMKQQRERERLQRTLHDRQTGLATSPQQLRLQHNGGRRACLVPAGGGSYGSWLCCSPADCAVRAASLQKGVQHSPCVSRPAFRRAVVT